AAAIVIGAGRAEHRIVMRADENDLRKSPANFCLDVVTGFSVQVVRVPPRDKAGAEKEIFDEIRGGSELRIARHVPLADFATKYSHVGDQFVTQFDLRR